MNSKKKKSSVEVLPRSKAAQTAIESVKNTKHNIKQRYKFNEIVKKIENYHKAQRTQEEKELDDWLQSELSKHKKYMDKIAKGRAAAKNLNSSQKTLVKSDSKKTLVNKKSKTKTKRKQSSSSPNSRQLNKRSRMLIL